MILDKKFRSDFTGEEVIDVFFETCDTDDDPGFLTLEEVKADDCLDLEATWFGLTKDDIDEAFEVLDKDQDEKISKEEATYVATFFDRSGECKCDPNTEDGKRCLDTPCENGISCSCYGGCSCSSDRPRPFRYG